MTWTIEFRPELPRGERFEVMEETAHRGTFNTDEEALAFARGFVENADIQFKNWPDDRPPEERLGGEIPQEQLDALASMDARAIVAESMLNNYHLLRTVLSTRQAIYHTICAKRGSASFQAEAYNAVQQAQAELDQCKYEILELMGVDS